MSKVPTELLEFIYDLDLNTSARHSLLRACYAGIITTVDQLLRDYMSGELARIHRIGYLAYIEIGNALARAGVSQASVMGGLSRGLKKMQDKVIIWNREAED